MSQIETQEALSKIPNKLYFRIGEVADLIGVKPYVLRYWETEFPDIKPSKSKSGQRLYKRRDVEMLFYIKELLYDERFTIHGARKRLKELQREARPAAKLKAEQASGDSSHQLSGHGNGNGHSKIAKEMPSNAETDQMKLIWEAAHEQPVMQGSGDHRKVLLKIKRDLEGLLTSIKN